MKIEQEALEYVKKLFANVDKAHDFDHTYRVYKNAIQILQKNEKSNREIVLLSAILHDVSDHKLFKDENNIDVWFSQHPSRYENEIRKAISEVSFSAGLKPSTLESMIVQDADRLDAIGAIGIARAFTYGGKRDRAIYAEEGESTIGHFYEKLFKIKDLLNTKEAKQIAESRNEFMNQFVKTLKDEIKGIK